MIGDTNAVLHHPKESKMVGEEKDARQTRHKIDQAGTPIDIWTGTALCQKLLARRLHDIVRLTSLAQAVNISAQLQHRRALASISAKCSGSLYGNGVNLRQNGPRLVETNLL